MAAQVKIEVFERLGQSGTLFLKNVSLHFAKVKGIRKKPCSHRGDNEYHITCVVLIAEETGVLPTFVSQKLPRSLAAARFVRCNMVGAVAGTCGRSPTT
jgi:hypothetical protein